MFKAKAQEKKHVNNKIIRNAVCGARNIESNNIFIFLIVFLTSNPLTGAICLKPSLNLQAICIKIMGYKCESELHLSINDPFYYTAWTLLSPFFLI